MKMKKRTRACVAQLLCLVYVAGTVVGCQTKEEAHTTEKLNYNSRGIYSTRVSLPDVTLSRKTTADDIQVYYYTMQDVGEEAGTKINQEQAEVKEIDVRGKHNLQVNFEDKNAAENATGAYFVSVKGQEEASAFVPVSYDTYFLQSDRDTVYPWEEKIQLQMALTGTTFSDEITAEDIHTGGSFERMKVNLVSAGKKNLTVELTGEMKRDSYTNVYLGGTVSVGRGGVENGYGDVSTVIAVEDTAVGISRDNLEIKDGMLSIPVLLSGGAFASEVKTESFVIEGLKVEKVERKSDQEIVVQISVDNKAETINQSIEILDGKVLDIKADATNTGQELSGFLTTSEASFYPVFDYADEEEGKLVFTLILMPQQGTFVENITKENFALGSDFSEGKIRSVDLQDDGNVELIMEIPAGELSVDTMNLSGTVTAASGTMVNVWGEEKDTETSYTRGYTQDTMGKGFGDAISAISETVDMLTNNPFYQAINSASGVASSVTGAVKTSISILEYFGVVQSEQSKQLQQLQDGVNKINDTLAEQNKSLDKLLEETYKDRVTSFSALVDKLKVKTNVCAGIYQNLRNVTGTDGLKEPSAPFTDDLKPGDEAYDEWKEYSKKAREVILDGDEKHNPYFDNAKNKFTDLENALIDVTTAMVRSQPEDNPFRDYDTLCTYAFNFDASSQSYREAYRALARYVVDYGYSMLCTYYDVWNYPGNNAFKAITAEYEKANAIIEAEINNVGERTDTAYCYVTKSYVAAEPFLISDDEIGNCANYSQVVELMKNRWQDIHNRAFITHMTAEQKDKFENRMTGRTMDEEMTLLFSNLGDTYAVPADGTVCLFNMAKDSYQFEGETTRDNRDQYLAGYMDAEYVVMPTDFTGERRTASSYDNDPSVNREDLMISFQQGDGKYYMYKALLNQ